MPGGNLVLMLTGYRSALSELYDFGYSMLVICCNPPEVPSSLWSQPAKVTGCDTANSGSSPNGYKLIFWASGWVK